MISVNFLIRKPVNKGKIICNGLKVLQHVQVNRKKMKLKTCRGSGEADDAWPVEFGAIALV
jgi:hypothetical protein